MTRQKFRMSSCWKVLRGVRTGPLLLRCAGTGAGCSASAQVPGTPDRGCRPAE